LLSDEAGLNTRLLDPEHGHSRIYWAQVERIPTPEALAQLAAGVTIQDYKTRACKAWLLDPQPDMLPRDPPIRVRKNIPDRWIALELHEGKNRQVRRMTAAIDHPTLRLIRMSIGELNMGSLASGAWRELSIEERVMIFR
jgi:23S rRNA pseudouridine2457 synthase